MVKNIMKITSSGKKLYLFYELGNIFMGKRGSNFILNILLNFYETIFICI